MTDVRRHSSSFVVTLDTPRRGRAKTARKALQPKTGEILTPGEVDPARLNKIGSAAGHRAAMNAAAAGLDVAGLDASDGQPAVRRPDGRIERVDWSKLNAKHR